MEVPDWHRVEVVQLLAPSLAGDDQAGVLQYPQVLHHAEPCHLQLRDERAERLTIARKERIQQSLPRRRAEGSEYCLHCWRTIGD